MVMIKTAREGSDSFGSLEKGYSAQMPDCIAGSLLSSCETALGRPKLSLVH